MRLKKCILDVSQTRRLQEREKVKPVNPRRKYLKQVPKVENWKIQTK